ncbi:MAG: hypothetical protein DMF76_00300 [Acidobacteria bacterium]|nr:MAG: hypothetical protein DMF76_00300 [Acidobacteriota bacterium]
MITILIAGYLTEFTGGRAEIKLNGSPATVEEALPHVNIFVNGETVSRNQVLKTSLDGDGEICIMPAVSGGCVSKVQSSSF